MPQIIVTAGDQETAVTLRERINASDFESNRFIANLLERIEWAVSDAAEAEHRAASDDLEATPVTSGELVGA